MRLCKFIVYTLCLLGTVGGCKTTTCSYHTCPDHTCPSSHEHKVVPSKSKESYKHSKSSSQKYTSSILPMQANRKNLLSIELSQQPFTSQARRRYVSSKQEDNRSTEEERRIWKSILESYRSKDFYAARRKTKDFEKELTYRELEQPERFDRVRWSRIVIRTALAQSYYMEGENMIALKEAEKALRLTHVDRARYKSSKVDKFNYSRLFGLVAYIFAELGERQGAIDSLVDRAKTYKNQKSSGILYYYGGRIAKRQENKYALYSRAVSWYSGMNDQEKKKYFREKQIQRAVSYIEAYRKKYASVY